MLLRYFPEIDCSIEDVNENSGPGLVLVWDSGWGQKKGKSEPSIAHSPHTLLQVSTNSLWVLRSWIYYDQEPVEKKTAASDSSGKKTKRTPQDYGALKLKYGVNITYKDEKGGKTLEERICPV